MSDDARCDCGSRIFFRKQTIITCADGSLRDIPSVEVMECVRCARTYIVSTECGKKTLKEFRGGFEGEKALFVAALDSWKNTDKPDTNASFIVTEEGDKADFARLGVS